MLGGQREPSTREKSIRVLECRAIRAKTYLSGRPFLTPQPNGHVTLIRPQSEQDQRSLSNTEVRALAVPNGTLRCRASFSNFAVE